MNWSRIREHNRRATSRKNERERNAVKHTVAIDALGGPFTVGELRAAVVKVIDLPHPVRGNEPHPVWFLRGREWLIHNSTGGEVNGLMLASDLRNFENCRSILVPHFKSVAAKNYAVEKTNEVWSKYETTGSEPIATTLF